MVVVGVGVEVREAAKDLGFQSKLVCHLSQRHQFSKVWAGKGFANCPVSVDHKICTIVKNTTQYKSSTTTGENGRQSLWDPPRAFHLCLFDRGCRAGMGHSPNTPGSWGCILPAIVPAAPTSTSLIIPRTQGNKFSFSQLAVYATGAQATLCVLMAAPWGQVCAGFSWNGMGPTDRRGS